MNRKGFSLIEVMISIAILALISIMVTQTTTKSFQLREDLSVEGEFHNGIKLAMNVVERDITHVFSPLMMMIKAKTGEGQTPFTQSAPNPGPFWGPALDEAGIRNSRFQGQEKKMSFITSSHERVYKDSRESLFAKITYNLEPDPKPAEGQEGTLALFRTVNTNAFEVDGDERKTDKTYKILSGIKSGSFKYFQRGKDIWQRSWDTEANEYKNHFPDTVELLLEVVGPRQLSFQGRYHYRLEEPIHGIFPST
ncbi:MAG: prepilin-type N-terminal cleavage/methylation domain-containing protein [Xanthomonadaceae bacterium]|nr:prepilin-type N-terminal cleavage/methylation domain-containing protein [Xanthomonadaceae bacterium]